ncbi:MAG: hypothetical protein WC114_05940 [Smithellaceae bacterium]
MPSSDELQNPCRICDHHLAGGDKNADCCMECADRVRYVAAIGGMFVPVPIEMTDMGRRRPAINKEESMNNPMSTTDVRVPVRAKDPSPEPRPETTRTCNKCGETKPLDEFRKNHTCLHGREPVCKDCKNIEARRKTAEARAKRLAANQPKPIPKKDLETTKACRVCGETKPLVQFVINKTCKDGHESICKDCRRITTAKKVAEKRSAAAETTAAPAGTGIPLVITAPPDPSTGNLLEDYMETKICMSCGKTKALALFPNDNASNDGRTNVCKECCIGQPVFLSRTKDGQLGAKMQAAKVEAAQPCVEPTPPKPNSCHIINVIDSDHIKSFLDTDAGQRIISEALALTPAYLRKYPDFVMSDNYKPELSKYAPAEPDPAPVTAPMDDAATEPRAEIAWDQPSGLRSQPSALSSALSPLETQIGGDHYKNFAIQPIEFTTRNRLGFIEGCVVKRICRYNRPGGKGLQDLLKIKHEIDCLIAIDEKEKAERSQGRQV